MTTEFEKNTQVEYDDLGIYITRNLDAPIELAFDICTKEEYVRKTLAPFGETVTACEIDLKVGGEYCQSFLSPDGSEEMIFRGRFLEIERPNRVVSTWHYEGWPEVQALETRDFSSDDNRTIMKYSLVFETSEGRQHMKTAMGILANLEHEANLMAEIQR